MKWTGISFIFHLLGITIWVGSSLLLPLAILPAVRKLESAAQISFLQSLKSRFLPLLTASGVVVGLTGWFQTMAMEKDLSIPAIYTKHIVILLLIAVSAYFWFFLTGKLIRSLSENKAGWSRYALFSWIQAILAIMVLICTGWLTQ